MTTANIPRVNFFDKQFLRVGEFRDEQQYHLAARRRHNLTQHSWGIVQGLELAGEKDQGLVLLPGLAIDGYGRELLLTEKKRLNESSFDGLGTDELDAWLVYDRRDGAAAPDGFSCPKTADVRDAYRSEEIPQVLLERPVSTQVDPRRPPGVSDDLLNAIVPPVSDDPRDVWRVYLGRITRLAQNKFTIDMSRRAYAGLVGDVVDHPANATRLEVGKESTVVDKRVVGNITYKYDNKDQPEIDAEAGQSAGDVIRGSGRFAVFLPEDTESGDQQSEVLLLPRLEVLRNGAMHLRGRTVVQGNLRIVNGAVQFSTPAVFTTDHTPQEPAIYRIEDKAVDQLRIDLGAANTLNREFVIGFSNAEGEFTTCLKIDIKQEEGAPGPSVKVTINGDLKLNGELIGDDLVPRTLNEEVINAIKTSFQAGVAAGNNQ